MDDTLLDSLPGGELIRQGLADLARGGRSKEALLVLIGGPRLRRLGLPVPKGVVERPEHALYLLLADSVGDAAHSQYNALLRRLVSFERAAECAA
jgi:hypothetical protein